MHLVINLAGNVAFGQHSNSKIDFCKVECILNLVFKKKAAFKVFGMIDVSILTRNIVFQTVDSIV